VSKSTVYTDISDILQMVEALPINYKLEVGIDSKVPLDDKTSLIAKRLGFNDSQMSFMDIVKLLTNFIAGTYSKNKDKITPFEKLDEVQKMGFNYPSQYLLFDFCLAALDDDFLNAKLFLGHAINIIGLSNQLSLLLSAIVYTPLTDITEVRELLALLALEVQPVNMEPFIELYGEEFQKRFQKYENEIIRMRL
jgi:hypothetical protein